MSFLDSIKNFNKRNLKDCVTVEKNIVEIKTEPSKKPKGHYSYHAGHAEEEAKIEWFEAPQKLHQKCKKLAHLIANANHVVIYTGAGISTAAKLPDYRGSDGMWTVKDSGANHNKVYTTISDAIPTYAHFAIAELVKRGKVQFVVSTNVDGLHMRTGLKRGTNLAELHGNSYLEVCNRCKKQYLRSKDVLQNQTTDHRAVDRHWCGATCEVEGCNGLLLDTIVAFGEFLPQDQLQISMEESKKGDLAIVLGSTMMVQPACQLPSEIYGKEGGKMVICNLQNTPYDDDALFLIHAYIDDIFYLVLRELGVEMPNDLELYDGMKIPISYLGYSYRADDEYPEKLEAAIKKYNDVQKEKLENKNQSGNAITRGENPYQRSVITNIGNQEANLHFEKVELVFMHRCHDCTYTIETNTKKIVIENCKDMIITINAKVITSVVEIINSSNIKLIVNVPIFTITVDNSNDVSLQYQLMEYFQMVAWAKALSPSLCIEGNEADLSIFSHINIDQDQVITKIENGSIYSSITQRDQCGRITQLVPK